MNHLADIDEGYEVFDDEKERQAAEAAFRKHPQHAAVQIAEGVTFAPRTVNRVHLVGSLRSDRRTEKPQLFDFEDGYMEAIGLFSDDRTIGHPVTVAVRWSNYGKTVETAVLP